MKCVHEIWLLTTSYDFNISTVHVTSLDNARGVELSQAGARSQHLDRFADMCSEFRSYNRVEIKSYVFKLMYMS